MILADEAQYPGRLFYFVPAQGCPIRNSANQLRAKRSKTNKTLLLLVLLLVVVRLLACWSPCLLLLLRGLLCVYFSSSAQTATGEAIQPAYDEVSTRFTRYSRCRKWGSHIWGVGVPGGPVYSPSSHYAYGRHEHSPPATLPIGVRS